MKIHKLKTWPEYFELMTTGKKTFELRENDRDFKIGDRLDLLEFDPNIEVHGAFTGRHTHVFVTHILGENPFIDLGNKVIMSVTKIEP